MPLPFIQPFGQMPDGAEASLFTLGGEDGLQVSITDFGGAITSIWAPDRHGEMADIVLGYDLLEGYRTGKSFFGALVGRFANRIAGGNFTLDGTAYTLPLNDGVNHLHGGPAGFDRVLWEAEPLEIASNPALKLTRTSPAGEQGYPGDLRVQILYTLEDAQTLKISYRAECDQATPLNLTNHSYFNLAGHAAADILQHEVTLPAKCFTPTDVSLIPTGELRSVIGTPFDFSTPHTIGERIGASDLQLQLAGGYDHNFVLGSAERTEPIFTARVRDPQSGRILEVFTTAPGMQFYSGNFLDGSEIGKGSVPYLYRQGFCLETQHFPDSPNQPAFPNAILRPGEIFSSTTLYRVRPE